MADSMTEQKKRRYDRQLRLWGEHGQAAMEDCSICLINGSATGAETLKNLVLPGAPSIARPRMRLLVRPCALPPSPAGIGAFTIVDGAVVTAADLGNNFFLEEESLGKPRAQCVTELLMELNEHVSGSYVTDDIGDVLSSRPEFLHSFTLVIATQMGQADLKRVSAICAARKLPLIVVHTYGFLGYLRLDLGEHPVSICVPCFRSG
jgi:amyloid beta precursor protein binding protein 1